MSDYSEVVEEILSIPKFTKEKHDFTVLREYLARLGNPEKGKRVIHVAGTNGKGSVTRLLSGLLQNAGRRVGSFYSPHLVRMNERIRVAGEEISDENLVSCYDAVKKVEEGLPRLTFFEILFVMAMVHFDRENVQDIVLETGLGGRLDATTAIPADLYVITQIGLDHEEYLGHTIEEVAREKAGIITGSSPVIYHTGSDEADRVIEDAARAMGVTVIRNCRKDEVKVLCSKFSGVDFSVRNDYHSYYAFHLSTPAAYQVVNAVTVIEAAEVLFSGTELTAEGLSDKGISDVGLSDEGFSDEGIYGERISDVGLSDEGFSDEGIYGERISDEGISDEGISDEGVSDEGISDEGISDEGISDEGVSDEGGTEEGIYDKEFFGELSPGNKKMEALLRKTFQEFSWEGRLSKLFPGFYLDGAHNPAAADELVRSLRALFSVTTEKVGSGQSETSNDEKPNDEMSNDELSNDELSNGKMAYDGNQRKPENRRRLIYAASRDKNVEGVLRILSEIRWDELWLVSYRGDRSADVKELLEMTKKIFPEETSISAFPSVNEVMDRFGKEAMDRFGKEADIFTLATGSLYLVGEIKAACEGRCNKDMSF